MRQPTAAVCPQWDKGSPTHRDISYCNVCLVLGELLPHRQYPLQILLAVCFYSLLFYCTVTALSASSFPRAGRTRPLNAASKLTLQLKVRLLPCSHGFIHVTFLQSPGSSRVDETLRASRRAVKREKTSGVFGDKLYFSSS
jgi:hypothetical protein